MKKKYILLRVCNRWGLDEDFKRSYNSDYKEIQSDPQTSWLGKYITSIYGPDEHWMGARLNRKELQPVPDYIRWLETGKMHYLTLERTVRLSDGAWSHKRDLFRPDMLLDLLFTLNSSPTEENV